MKNSIYDVAELSGVSIATVSRVLNGKGYVSPETESKVRKALQQLDFTPSEVARGLANKSTKTIGVYFPSIELSLFNSEYLFELFRGITDGLISTEYDLLLIHEDKDFDLEKGNGKPKYLSYLQGNRVDGLIIGLKYSDDSWLQKIISQSKSIVYMGSRIANSGYNVYGNFMKYNNAVLDYCWEKGHKNIGVINYFTIRYFLQDIRMKKIYEEFYNRKNWPLDWRNYLNVDDTTQLYSSIEKMLNREDAPSVLYCPAFSSMQKVLSILNSMGKKVPDDISLIGVEQRENQAADLLPRITSVYVPAYEMGKSSVDLLLKLIERKRINKKEIVFDPSIIERNSVKFVGKVPY